MKPLSIMNPRSVFFLLLSVISSCCVSRKEPPKTVEKPSTAFWKPYLLYLNPKPHERLYVEVDAVEGCGPSCAELQALEDLLKDHCHKPCGIEIRENSVIPRAEAKGLSRRELTRAWMNGPPASERSAAYLYVLYYDGRLGGKRKTAKANPHTELLPYPAAIFINRGYMALLSRWVRNPLIQHEAGHVLGLALRSENAKAGHCTEEECLMRSNIAIHMPRLLTGRDPVTQKTFCQHCLKQLKTTARQPPVKNLSFVGPVLVRQEEGYRVLSLPGSIALAIGGGREEAAKHFLNQEQNRKTTPGEDPDQLVYHAWIEDGIMHDRAKARASLDRACRDPYGMVRQAAQGLRKQVFP
jgi:hypothetical protein